MTAFHKKISEVKKLFSDGDYSLGFRRLTDCVLDIGEPNWYDTYINLYDWKENNVNDVKAINEKVFAFIESIKNENIPDAVNQSILLSANNIAKTYSGNKSFKLKNVSLQIKTGEVIGLVGENGNGKTTLLRILSNDLHYDEGEIVYGFKNNATDKYDLRTKLAYIPQRTPQWYGSIKNNLKFTLSHYGIKGNTNEKLVLMMMIRFGLWPFRNMKWSELSSGYKMRFELARTLLRSPKLLLLDEPLANLDIFAQQIILEDLKFMAQSLRAPFAIVLSSQQLYEVEKISDEVIFLKNGSPKSFNEAKTEEQNSSELIFELETANTKDEILVALKGMDIKDIQFNGGTYLFSIAGIQSTEVLGRFSQNNIVVKYFRDITHSTRRFFS